MNKLIKIMLIVLLSALSVSAMARPVRGRVLGPDNQPLIGAGVIEKGSTTNGTTTDMDGKYQIDAKGSNPILVFSYIGCVPQEVQVGNMTVIDVTLQDAANELNTVVVTALGIKREAKALGYAVTNVSGDVMPAFSKTNPLQALSGLVPGLNISSSGSGAGGSNKVTIRGVSSLTGSNEPLYVVDGVPVDNAGGASGNEYGGTDYGSSVNNINPDDIDNISVLKGGAAAALYGSRGQNGVIMITTKKGSQRSNLLGVKYSYQLQTNTPNVIPDFQNEYSQGSAGAFIATNYQSWGVKMAGQEVTNFLGQKQNLESLSNPYKDFFKTGISHNHSISVNKKGDNLGIYVSYTNTAEKGIVPNNRFDKNSVTARLDGTLGGFVTIDVKANYIIQKGFNRPDLGGSPDNPVYEMYNLPRSVSLDQLETYATKKGEPIVWTEQYATSASGDIITTKTPTYASSPLLNNPYWSRELNTNHDVRNRLISFAESNIDLKKLFNLPFTLNLKGRAGVDYYTDNRYRRTATDTYFKADGLATISQSNTDFKEFNYDFLLSGSKKFGKLGFNGSFGGNLMKRYSDGLYSTSESGTINTQGPYVIQNFNNVLVSQSLTENEIQSLYGLLSFDWDSQVYLDLTARNDWTSMLSAANRSIFYPSVSASWIISETFAMPKKIDMLKVRASWASVGSGGNYSSYRYNIYGTNTNQFHGLPYGFIPSARVNPDLKSEFTISQEVGANLVMFGNRLNVDLAYYQSGTKDQIFQAAIAPSSGNDTGIINAGYISNSGLEAQLRGSIIRTDDMEWWSSLNFTYQWNKVKDLPDAVPILTLGGIDGMTINAQNGIPVGSMQGTAFNRDANGNIVLDKDNLPTIKQNENGANDVNVVLGNIYPKYMIGFNTGFKYKRFSASMLIDSKLDYDIYSYTNMAGARLGVLASTVKGRDEWETAKQVYASTGILPNMGYMIKGVKNGVIGDYAVDPQQYWSRVASINENWVYDASFIRLRQITASYLLPSKVHGFKHVGDVEFSLGANNICYLMKKTPNISPESVSTTGNAAGYEVYAMPETLTFTFGVNVSF